MKAIKLISYQLIILFISLFIIEIFLRISNSDMNNYDIEMWRYAKELKISDPVLGHKHLKNKSSILQGVEIKLNSLGMRSEEDNSAGNKILFLGSSISLGWGVKNNDSYPMLIQKKLESNKLNYKILNGSVGNYNTNRYVNNFLINQKAIDVDLIVVNYFINDVETLPINNSNWFVKNSQLVASLSIAYKKLNSKANGDLKSYYNKLYEYDNFSFLEMRNSLKKLSEYCHKKKVPLILVVIPDIHFLEDYPFQQIHEKMNEISNLHNFHFHDMLKKMKGIPFEELQIIRGDSHPNEYGHKIMAESLYPKLYEIIVQLNK